MLRGRLKTKWNIAAVNSGSVASRVCAQLLYSYSKYTVVISSFVLTELTGSTLLSLSKYSHSQRNVSDGILLQLGESFFERHINASCRSINVCNL